VVDIVVKCSLGGGRVSSARAGARLFQRMLRSVIGKPSACSDLSMIGVVVWLILQPDQKRLFGAQGA